jgi:hypothetical protein
VSPAVLLGLVGYCPFMRSYPLGPELLERIVAAPWPAECVLVRELNWSPIAIVQDWQAEPLRPARAVLVAATDRGHPPHTVSCRRWAGGPLGARATQQRIFEAVTGIVNLDNLLVIGEHFGVWPAEVLTIELQLAEPNVGAFVMAELGRNHLQAGRVVGEQPLHSGMVPVVQRMAELARLAVLRGPAGLSDLSPLGVADLRPPPEFCHHSDVRGSCAPAESSIASG